MTIPINLLSANLDTIAHHVLDMPPTEARSNALQGVAELYNLIDRAQRDEINGIMKVLARGMTEGMPLIEPEVVIQQAVPELSPPKPFKSGSWREYQFSLDCDVCGALAGNFCYQMSRRGRDAKPTKKPLMAKGSKAAMHVRRGKV